MRIQDHSSWFQLTGSEQSENQQAPSLLAHSQFMKIWIYHAAGAHLLFKHNMAKKNKKYKKKHIRSTEDYDKIKYRDQKAWNFTFYGFPAPFFFSPWAVCYLKPLIWAIKQEISFNYHSNVELNILTVLANDCPASYWTVMVYGVCIILTPQCRSVDLFPLTTGRNEWSSIILSPV